MWRTGRFALAVAALVALAAVGAALLAPAQGESRFLDPADTGLSGSAALAQLLRQRGVTVDRVDSVASAVAKGRDRLLLVTSTTHLSWDDLDRLAALTGDRVVVGTVAGLDRLAPGANPQGQVRERSREPDCGLPAARAAGSVHIGGYTFSGANGCYPADKGAALVSFQQPGGTTTVVGSGTFMTNGHLAEDGNAALALSLLSTEKAVTWLVDPPRPPQNLAGPGGRPLSELVPPNVPWAALSAVLAVLVAAFWRGRRLGPVVTEKLPVIVRAAETVEGRGRLYRSGRARDRAADVLRAGAIDRLTPLLGLGYGAGQQEVVAALAARTGRNPHELGSALYGPPPADDAALVALAGYLDSIERNVSEH
ncbi:DUF4350 domain-containing protein [Nonomuraea longicatena]|uniref:DUF4350 domain-containing protein n=2 Tax=Nonomuraea longicatena TaxID=83682 RepID=A0ABN1PG83_9ACTN